MVYDRNIIWIKLLPEHELREKTHPQLIVEELADPCISLYFLAGVITESKVLDVKHV